MIRDLTDDVDISKVNQYHFEGCFESQTRQISTGTKNIEFFGKKALKCVKQCFLTILIKRNA